MGFSNDDLKGSKWQDAMTNALAAVGYVGPRGSSYDLSCIDELWKSEKAVFEPSDLCMILSCTDELSQSETAAAERL